MNMFNPANWYWAVGGSTTQVYSSARNIYVPVTDAVYETWLAAYGGPTPIANEALIWHYVSPFLAPWLFNGTTFAQPAAGAYTPAQLIAYAAAKQATVSGGGFTAAVSSGVNVWASTDTTSLILLQGAASIAASTPSQTFQWVPEIGLPTTLSAAQMTTLFGKVSAFLQETFATLAGIISAVNAGTITATAQIDAPPSPIPAWPVNS